MYSTSPEAFADYFNAKVPYAYRGITSNDVLLMTECNLICRHGFYGSQDLEVVRGILQYEQMREKRSARCATEEQQLPPSCKMCRQLLPAQSGGKKGRPREYCVECEPFRNRDRQQRLVSRRRKPRNKFLLTKTSPSLRQLHREPRQ